MMTLCSQMPSGRVWPCAQAILCCQALFLHPGVSAPWKTCVICRGGSWGLSMALPSGDHFQGTKTTDTEAPPAGLQRLLLAQSRGACVWGDAELTEQSLLLGEQTPAPPGNRWPNEHVLAGCPSAHTARPWKPASLAEEPRAAAREGSLGGAAGRRGRDGGAETSAWGRRGLQAEATAASASCQKVGF